MAVVPIELSRRSDQARRIEPQPIERNDGDPVTTQFELLQLRVMRLLACELELAPEVLVPKLVGDGGLQLVGREDRERGLGDQDGRPGQKCQRRGPGPQHGDVDGGLSIVVAEDGREHAQLGPLPGRGADDVGLREDLQESAL